MSDSGSDGPPDYYGQLGVSPSASREEIQEAYRRKARETHPDRNPDDPAAAQRFQQVKTAYQVLQDPQRRARYDDARAAQRRIPSGLTMNQQAPAGCGGYMWRVAAGMLAFGLFLALEAMDVWAGDLWTIILAVGGASLGAGAMAFVLARQFPDEATDVMVRLTGNHVLMRADGRTTFRLSWDDVHDVHIDERGWTLVLVVEPKVAQALRAVPPVLTSVQIRSDEARLWLDLSDTDVPRDILHSFLRRTDAIPFTDPRKGVAPRRP